MARLIAGLLIVLMATASACSAATLNVLSFGAKADGMTDDTAAFNAALKEATKAPGSVVMAPSGRYLIAGTIGIPFYTTLQGEYQGPSKQEGTVLLATGGKGKADGPGCIACSGNSTIRNLAIQYPEQSADSKEPVPYPYAITLAGNSRIDTVLLLNPYQGILADEAPAALIRDVWGEPLRVGIRVDHILDILRIENVHFTPMFTEGRPLRDWVQSNGVAFEFGRSDWQYCLNTFCYGYWTGYRFFKGADAGKNRPAGVTNGNFLGIGADSCHFCIEVEDSFNIGVSITNGEFAPFKITGSRGVLMKKGNTGNLTLTNCNFWANAYSVAEVQDGSLNMSACNISDWAWSSEIPKEKQPEMPAFIVSGGRLNINNCTFNRGGLLATLEGSSTRALFTGNMGTEPMTVLNAMGNRAAAGVNNPVIKFVGATSPGGGKLPVKDRSIPEMPDH